MVRLLLAGLMGIGLAPIAMAAPAPKPLAVSRPAAADVAAIEAYRRLCEQSGADTCLVIRNGKTLVNWAGAGYRERGSITMMSSTKSVTALLVGMLVEDGKLKSIDEPVGHYLPEWNQGPRAAVTIRHLLSHTSGLDIGHDPERSVGMQSEKYAYVRALVPARPPGVAFSYSNEGVALLAPLMEKAAGESLNAYAARRLFTPLGLKRTRFYEYPEGQAWTYADMETMPGEFARFGQLMLNGGVWEGKRLVSANWVKQLTTPSQPFEPKCGLLWWLEPETQSFATLGYRATNMHVFPRSGLIVVRSQRKAGPMSEALYSAKAVPLLRRMAGLPASPGDDAAIRVSEALDAFREGKLPEAQRLTDGLLRTPTLTLEQRAEARLIAALVANRQEKAQEAKRHLVLFRQEARGLPAGHWTLETATRLEHKLNAPASK